MDTLNTSTRELTAPAAEGLQHSWYLSQGALLGDFDWDIGASTTAPIKWDESSFDGKARMYESDPEENRIVVVHSTQKIA